MTPPKIKRRLVFCEGVTADEHFQPALINHFLILLCPRKQLFHPDWLPFSFLHEKYSPGWRLMLALSTCHAPFSCFSSSSTLLISSRPPPPPAPPLFRAFYPRPTSLVRCCSAPSRPPLLCHSLFSPSKWDVHAFLTRAEGCACTPLWKSCLFMCLWVRLVCKWMNKKERKKKKNRGWEGGPKSSIDLSERAILDTLRVLLFPVAALTTSVTARDECSTGYARHPHITTSRVSDHPDFIPLPLWIRSFQIILPRVIIADCGGVNCRLLGERKKKRRKRWAFSKQNSAPANKYKDVYSAPGVTVTYKSFPEMGCVSGGSSITWGETCQDIFFTAAFGEF